MPELLCRRDRDGDGVNDEFAVRKDLGFLMGTDSWVASTFNGTKSQGPRNRWFEIRIEGQIFATSPRPQLNAI